MVSQESLCRRVAIKIHFIMFVWRERIVSGCFALYFLHWYEFQWHFYCNYGVDGIKRLVIVSPAVIMSQVKSKAQLCAD